MKSKLLLILLLIAGISQTSSAQYYGQRDELSSFYIGPGFGLEHGGLGVKIEGLPSPYLGIFGGIGYNFAGPGLNGGLTFHALPYNRFCPIVEAMYGYNAAIIIDEYFFKSKTTYYGPSFGGGLDIRVGHGNNKLHFGIYYPIRSSKFHDDYDALKNSGTSLNMSPITWSAGFNFAL